MAVKVVEAREVAAMAVATGEEVKAAATVAVEKAAEEWAYWWALASDQGR